MSNLTIMQTGRQWLVVTVPGNEIKSRTFLLRGEAEAELARLNSMAERRPLTAAVLRHRQYAMNPASPVYPDWPDVEVRAQSPRTRPADEPVVILNRPAADGRLLLSLTRRELELVRTSCKAKFGKARRQHDKNPDFVPAEGHFDVNRSYMATLSRVIFRIDDLLGSPHDPAFDYQTEDVPCASSLPSSS